MKVMANDFEGPFKYILKNREIYKKFSVPIKKEVIKMDKDGNKSVETISYKIEFIDSMRFMATSLSKRVDNLKEGIHTIKCKYCDCCFEYKCLSCNKEYSKRLMKN